jgi:phospholipase C
VRQRNCHVGTTHFSAANYLGISAGQYPPAAAGGCGSVATCASSGNLYHQLDLAGLTGRGYIEAMPTACARHTAGQYKLGHNPVVFYRDISRPRCRSADLPVRNLTIESGAFWRALQNKKLPSFSWITPDERNDGEGPGAPAAQERAADKWLRGFLGIVARSRSCLAGGTLVLVTYDEGNGRDLAQREDCTDKSLDMPVRNGVSAHQDSCHVPLFVVYPYTPSGHKDGAFFDGYSITKTVEQLFGLPRLAHASDAQTASLIGHFRLPARRKHGRAGGQH